MLKFNIDPEAWASLWRCIRPALWLALVLNLLCIFQILLGHGDVVSRDFGSLLVPVAMLGAIGLAYWLFRMVRDLLVFAFKLAVAYVIVQARKLWAAIKKARANVETLRIRISNSR